MIRMKYLSDKHIRIIQLVNLLVLVLVFFLSILLWKIHGSIFVGLKVLLIGAVFWGPVFLLYLKLFEIKLITREKIAVSNLLKKYQFKKDDIDEISPTLLPLVYKISFKRSHKFFFMIPVENIFRILFVNSEKIIAEMRLAIEKD